jgi:hypothetical protein
MTDQKPLVIMEYFNRLDSVISDIRRTCKSKARIAMVKAELNKKKT